MLLSWLQTCVRRFCCLMIVIFFFKQKTAYEMRISDWSSDVCSSDLIRTCRGEVPNPHPALRASLSRKPERGWNRAGTDKCPRAGKCEFRRPVTERHRAVGAGGNRGKRPMEGARPRLRPCTAQGRSRERLVRKESVRTCKSTWSAQQ